MGDLNKLTAAEAALRIERREITSEELVRDCLVHIEAREDEVSAWPYIDPNRAIDQALLCDRTPRRSRLHGIPVGVKDVIETADMPTTHGSAIYAGKDRQSARYPAYARLLVEWFRRSGR